MGRFSAAYMDRQAKEKLLSAYRILDQFSHCELPSVSENCRRARSEISQILLRFGALGDIDVTLEEERGLFVDG